MLSWEGGEMLFLWLYVKELDKEPMKKVFHHTSTPIHKQYEYIKFTAFGDSKDEWLPSHNPDLFVKAKCFHSKQSAFRAQVISLQKSLSVI